MPGVELGITEDGLVPAVTGVEPGRVGVPTDGVFDPTVVFTVGAGPPEPWGVCKGASIWPAQPASATIRIA